MIPYHVTNLSTDYILFVYSKTWTYIAFEFDLAWYILINIFPTQDWYDVDIFFSIHIILYLIIYILPIYIYIIMVQDMYILKDWLSDNITCKNIFRNVFFGSRDNMLACNFFYISIMLKIYQYWNVILELLLFSFYFDINR